MTMSTAVPAQEDLDEFLGRFVTDLGSAPDAVQPRVPGAPLSGEVRKLFVGSRTSELDH